MRVPLLLFVIAAAGLAAPLNPARLTARPVHSGEISLTWQAVTGAVSYNVYRAGSLVGTASAPIYEDTTVAEATAYTYHVTAVDAAGAESSASQVAVSSHDRYGASPLVQCGGNPSPVRWTVSAVQRSGTTAYYYVASPNPEGDSVGAQMHVGMAFSLAGSTTDGGSFNASPGNWLYVDHVYMATPPYYFTVTNQVGNAVTKTVDSGTLTLATWYLQKIRSEWWFCSPLDHGMKAMGVYKAAQDGGIDAWGVQNSTVVSAKYANGPYGSLNANWMMSVLMRLRWWSFNVLDEQYFAYLPPWGIAASYWTTTPDHTPVIKMSAMTGGAKTSGCVFNRYARAPGSVKNLMAGINKSVYNSTRLTPDFFDSAPYSPESNWPAWVNADFAGGSSVPPSKYQDYLVGLGVDDRDDHPWAGAGGDFRTISVDGAAKNGFHAAWITLVTSPVQAAAQNSGTYVVFAYAEVYSKTRLKTFLQSRYDTIANLNLAWGASYSQWDSQGAAASVALSTSDGTNFAGTLTGSNLTPCSVQVIADGVVVAGDDCNGNMIRKSATQGTTGALAGVVSYSSGSLSVDLTGIASLNAVSARYATGGWGSGTGLMDENGIGHAWVPTIGTDASGIAGNFVWSSPPTATQQAAFKQDMDDFLYLYASQYFSVIRAAGRKYFPGVPYVGLSSIGSWQTPARVPVLEAARDNCDLLRLDGIDQTKADALYGDYLTRMRFITTHGGDRPWTWWMGITANAGSYFAGSQSTGSYDVSSQTTRAQAYDAFLKKHLAADPDGIVHTVGINWWAYYDTRGETSNYGLVDQIDDAYDGREPGANGGACSYPLSDYKCGIVTSGNTSWWEHACGTVAGNATGVSPVECAAQPYGDFLGPVTHSNVLWVPSIPNLTRTSIKGARLTGMSIP